MKTMAQIDAWYDAEINNAKVEGEQRQKQEIALNLLRENVPIEIVSRTTGLTIDRLQQLQASQVKD
ncbi:hypothetical protein [Chamaesiphon sp. VAR_48_metabat_135_sub]|uniref:hypothetical protein n=1 Tax=Chamaesiphon sp. VAR_48_metabat_135_sub TaxID=2964699 RepID=UPI00286CF4C3|nr:hypothetical protein [Chamaesiphon sp. VAR_48_metabat_135_sub]